MALGMQDVFPHGVFREGMSSGIVQDGVGITNL